MGRRRRIIANVLVEDVESVPVAQHGSKRKSARTIAEEYKADMKSRREEFKGIFTTPIVFQYLVFHATYSALPSATRALVNAFVAQTGAEPDDDINLMPMDPYGDVDPEPEDDIEPPEISHEGGEAGNAADAVYVHILGYATIALDL